MPGADDRRSTSRSPESRYASQNTQSTAHAANAAIQKGMDSSPPATGSPPAAANSSSVNAIATSRTPTARRRTSTDPSRDRAARSPVCSASHTPARESSNPRHTAMTRRRESTRDPSTPRPASPSRSGASSSYQGRSPDTSAISGLLTNEYGKTNTTKTMRFRPRTSGRSCRTGPTGSDRPGRAPYADAPRRPSTPQAPAAAWESPAARPRSDPGPAG